MAAQCEVKMAVNVTGLGNELNLGNRFVTTNTPEGCHYGYGTIAAADTYEAVDLGQVAASLVDGLYIRSIDETVYLDPACSLAGTEKKMLRIDESEAAFFRPVLSDTALSVMVVCSTAGASYEYFVVGQTS